MMKKISIIFCILICSVFVFGQNEIQNKADWIKFSPKGEEFVVETPVSFNSQSFSEDNSSRRYYCQTEQNYFFIFVEERKSKAKNNLEQFKNLISFVTDYQTNGLKGTFGEDEAEKYEFVDSEGFFHIVIIVKTFDFIQVFQTVSETKNDYSAQRFISSIRIKNNSSNLVEFPQNKKVEEKKVEISKKENEKLVNIGKGSGRGNGIGSGGSEPSKTQSTQTTPLTITSKPRSPYTDYARFYLITGTVMLRVTFLANGKIGAVTPVTKLPFGLTTNSINAAKQLTFLSPTKEGVPFTVIKQLQYNFTLY